MSRRPEYRKDLICGRDDTFYMQDGELYLTPAEVAFMKKEAMPMFSKQHVDKASVSKLHVRKGIRNRLSVDTFEAAEVMYSVLSMLVRRFNRVSDALEIAYSTEDTDACTDLLLLQEELESVLVSAEARYHAYVEGYVERQTKAKRYGSMRVIKVKRNQMKTRIVREPK